MESKWRQNVSDLGLNFYQQTTVGNQLTLIAAMLDFPGFFISNLQSGAFFQHEWFTLGGGDLGYAGAGAVFDQGGHHRFPYGYRVEPDQ